MHLKSKLNKKDSLDSGQKRSHRKSQNMASSLVNDDEDNASTSTTTNATNANATTRNTQQQQQQLQQKSNNNSNNNNCNSSSSSNTNNTNCLNNNSGTKMHGNEAKVKKENLQQRKLELEKLLNEKSWLLQQLQKQETEILNGNFEYMNFNDFISNLAVQYKQEQQSTDGGSSTAGGLSQLSANEDAVLRRKPLTAKENHQQLVIHRRQSEISNRSSEYDNYPHHDTISTHSDGATSSAGRSGITMHQAQQAQQQYNPKSALKKRSATVAGTTQQQQQSMANLQMHLRHQQQQHHLEQQQQQAIYKQHHYHHPQQHLFKQHVEHHQVLMPHLQYATQKFYYTTLQPQTQSQSPQQQQPQYGRYLKVQHNNEIQKHQQQQLQQLSPQQHQQISPQQHNHMSQNAQQQSPTRQQQHHIMYTTNSSNKMTGNQQLLLTPPHATSSGTGAPINMDNISLYSLNSNNVATLHRQAQQQLPIIVQCDKYYLSPTTHHVSQNDGGGFIKSSQNIKEYISPLNSPQQHLSAMGQRERKLISQTNLSNRGATTTPSIDAISLAPSYMSMETVEYITAAPTMSQQQQHQQQQQLLQQHQHPSNLRWRSQTNLPPSNAMAGSEMKSHSSDMLNNNNYYHSVTAPGLAMNQQQPPPPQVTQVKPFKPLDDISINSFTSETQQKTKTKSKQWMESSLDGPVIRQTPTQHSTEQNDNQRSKLSSQSLNTTHRHYSMSAAQNKSNATASALSGLNNNNNNIAPNTKLSQSTSYLNQLEAGTACSISQAYNIEEISGPSLPSTQSHPTQSTSYKYLTNQGSINHSNNNNNNNKPPPPRPPLYINATNSSGGGNIGSLSPSSQALTVTTSPCMLGGITTSSGLSPDIRIESPKNMTVVQPATFQPYKEVTKPFEMSDFYKYSTKYRQKENSGTTNNSTLNPEN